MVKNEDIFVTKLFPNGAWEVSTMQGNIRISKRYFNYPKAEAIRKFKHELKQSNNVR